MKDEEVDIWAYYAEIVPGHIGQVAEEKSLIDRLRNTGPIQDDSGNWSGRFASWRDAHEAAELIESLERRITEYEDTIRYLTLQVSKNL